jgi:hypothetical protein
MEVSTQKIIFIVNIIFSVQVSSFKVHLYELTIYYKNSQYVATGSCLIARLTSKHTQIRKFTVVFEILRIDV